MTKIIIQDEISITQKEVDEIIKHYERLPDTFMIGILCTCLDKKGVIREIKKLSEVGKIILLMRYNYNIWKKANLKSLQRER